MGIRIWEVHRDIDGSGETESMISSTVGLYLLRRDITALVGEY
jgi:hypothetical protein